ncbi:MULTISPECIES: type VI secretion system-associated protein VasI [unclassified Pseudomonas]|jgi:type VI secretion system protein VasI|uniref:type VI secretion system-associated protein VasI n=1 Tax=unclassified Pseudomonas TaxID=196821 RepID=UPI000C885942|nr:MULTISPECIES: type VI secretion system-associated protein VasI [unclassified Pseudomonas]PMZ99061.1 type VI secretion system-associated protein TagO [Pseudomonas sp. FW305-42]PNA19617.1 type VI secretion system-associated protein TagO [Pseudomonas sp. MPR-R1B]PNB26246.1 type VI secretion system-associated protein TagO [Pseudomonas sp. DP16D-E2]PNB43433.1 type VI secretion system-associated protein TagO [Pseudomonas sp. FW305-17]PNB61818.1 type VI secretion system-associated protein TagO [Ps
MPLPVYSDQDCSRIVSNLERLACFDEAAGTPAHLVPMQWSSPEQDSPTVRRVLTHEAGRHPDDLTFRLTPEDEGLTISAPAIGSAASHPYLVISCLQNISRLQLVAAQPVDAGRVTVRLQGERSTTVATPWQVTENGQVLDAGRGLPGIEQIKQLIGAHRIEVQSDNPSIDGLVFDAQGLDPLIDEARKTCRW